MVYTVRHKAFWEFRPGAMHYDRNNHSFIKIMDPPKDQTIFMSYKNVSYFPFRYLHVYRTLKRAGNQFFQGNELLQNAFTLALRNMYHRVPEEMFMERYGGLEMLVHKGERHWELMTYNQHPLQQDIYEIFNTYCHNHYAEKTPEENQAEENYQNKIKELIDEKRKLKGLEEHETLELSDLQEVFEEAMKLKRSDPSSDYYVKTLEQEEKDFEEANPRRTPFFHQVNRVMAYQYFFKY